MALRFIDGANGYDTSQITRKWTSNFSGTINATSGRRGGPGLRFANWNDATRLTLDLKSTWVVGFGFRCTALPSVRRGLIGALLVSAGITQCSISLNADGTITAHRDWPPSNVVLGTSTAMLTAGVYCYLEVRFVINDVAGSIEVRKDGVSILNVTNVDTQVHATIAASDQFQFLITSSSEAGTIDFDDIYICDSSGIINNNFLGDLRVDAVFPNGVGNSSMLTPSAGSNWQNVDDDPADDDVTYNSASGTGAIDTYAFPDIAPTVGTVHGLVSYLTMKKDEAAVHTAQAVIRRGSTNYPSTHKTLTTSYAMYQEVHETDPSTIAQWTIANVNAAEFGLELIS